MINTPNSDWDLRVILSADVVVTNHLIQDVGNGFAFVANTGEVWEVEVLGSTSGNSTTGDVAVALSNTGTWGTAQSWCEGVAFNGAASLTATAPTAFASTTLSTASPGLTVNDGDGVIRPFRMRYVFVVTGSGTISLQTGNVSAGVGRTSTLKAKTVLRARQHG